jgi:hypothetical protein
MTTAAAAGGKGTTDTAAATTTTTTDKPAATDTKPAETKPAATTETKPAATTEGKADDTTTAKPAGKDGTQTAEPKAPEKYALKVPDGAEWLGTDELARFEKSARAKNLSNEQAQSVLDEAITTRAEESAAFRTVTESDPTYGGDNLAETQRLATLALDRIRPKGSTRGDSFRSYLTNSGHGNHLEVVSLLADLGKLMAEDQPGAPTSLRSAGKADPAKKLYPDMKD